MRFGILGATTAWRADGTRVPLGGPTPRALLALLLARAGQVVSADFLIDSVYGEQPPADATHALQSQISRLRRSFTIELLPGGYRLDVDPSSVDAHVFLRTADEGRAALEAGAPARAAELLREALALWRGPAAAEAVRLEERRLSALEDLFEAELRTGARDLAAALRAEIERHPLRERLRGQLMRALHAEGRQAEALVAYEETRRVLAEQLGADPSDELTAIHLSLLRGARPSAPPAPLTGLVGREPDLEGVRGLLREARLITLLGTGGVGKTRLAIEVARGDDVTFADLSAVGDGAELPQALLGALGLRESALLGLPDATTPASRLLAALAERPALLVMDNCEHLVDAVASLADLLLAGCPHLRILATSREPLGITGEHLWPVRPLAPDAAARLFAARARAVRPGFTADPDDVRRLCAALDGLPLAIELAAARMRTHEVSELADHLALRGSRTAGPRHRTLRAVVAWSWDLLADDERAMAARLTVFAGGATAADAEAVCGLPRDVLDSLVDKSLVEVSRGRYRMLETVRAFCAEHLTDPDPVRRAHADRFLALAEQADPHLRAADQLGWLDRLAAEHDNLMAALRWAVTTRRTELGIRLLAALSSYLWMRGVRFSAIPHATALLDQAGPEPDPSFGDDYVLCALTAAGDQDAWARHRAAAEAIAMDVSRARRHPLVTFLWPMVTASKADVTVVLAVLEHGRRSEDPWERAIVHVIWGYPHLAAGDLDAATAEFIAAVTEFRALGDRWGAAFALDSLSWLAAVRGDRATALALVEEAIELTGTLGALEDLADLLCSRGDYRFDDDLAAATADYERAEETARRTGSATCLAAALRGRADVALAEGDLPTARRLYEQALERFDERWVRSSGNLTRTLVGLGTIAEAEGDLEAAHAWHLRGAETSVRLGALPDAAIAIDALARLASDSDRAALLKEGARGLRGMTGVGHPSPEQVLRLAGVREELISHALALGELVVSVR
ncbi:BTAD domain-containing putative transcriptional regulator [Nonomuraea dietziae]|uniref:BTAD domain-containing putative transcriptional regulator n=1 Tax=Nonomuraea dietziae TaxID=65515 RepID=UPI00360EF92B